MNDPFRNPPSSPPKESTRMKDFFEGLDKVQYTIGWMFVGLLAAVTLSFMAHSCDNGSLVRSETIACVARCEGALSAVKQFTPGCECKSP